MKIQMGKFLKIILAIQLAAIGSFWFDYIGIEIPIFREMLCFIYLVFIPGILILGILRLDKLSMIETVLYSIGLSCSILMFVGLFMNTIYPVFGITKPLSTIYLLITLIILISALYLLCYARNADYTPSFFNSLNVNLLFSSYTLSFLLMPFLAIFGAYSVQFYDNNILLLLLLVLIAIIPIFVAFDKIPNKTYPLLIFVISISLLYHNVLSSMYIQGFDIHIEYYFANLVKLDSYWNPSIASTTNSLLIDTMLAPIFSKVFAMSLTWVFKIIYPFLLSLLPVALYQVYRGQTNDKIAFFACFFFMSFLSFYTSLPVHAKQVGATFFLSLLILLAINKKINNIKRTILLVIFIFSLIVSHYGTTYIFIIWLIFAYTSVLFGSKLGKIINTTNITTLNFMMLSIISALAWYMYTAGSSAFNAVVHIGDHVINSIFTEFLNPVEHGGVYWITKNLTIPWEIFRILNFISQFFILFGVAYTVIQKLKHKEKGTMDIQNDFLLFAIVCLVLLGSSIILPYSVGRGSMTLGRVYFLVLIILAPFCIIGGLKIMHTLSSFINKSVHFNYLISEANAFKFLSVFFAIFLLFNTNFTFEIIQETYGNDCSHSPSISQPRIKRCGTIEEKIYYYNYNYPKQDVYGAKWLGKHKGGARVLVDSVESSQILTSYGMIQGFYKVYPHGDIPRWAENSYVYLRKINYVDNIMHVEYSMRMITGYEKDWWNTSEIFPILEERNKIYSNGGSVVYK